MPEIDGKHVYLFQPFLSRIQRTHSICHILGTCELILSVPKGVFSIIGTSKGHQDLVYFTSPYPQLQPISTQVLPSQLWLLLLAFKFPAVAPRLIDIVVLDGYVFS